MTALIEPRVSYSVVRIAGPLRMPGATRLTQQVQALLDRGEREILLNLAQLTDVDAAGVVEMVHAYNMTAAAGGVLWIAYAESHVRQLLQTAGVLGLLSEGPRG